MKAKLLIFLLTLIPVLHGQTSKELLRDGLFAEESDGDLKTATEKYEALLKSFEKERKVAAVALYRLAAVKRKQGEEKAALALYEQFGKQFGDVEPQASLVKEDYLAISGKEFPSAEGGFTEEDNELARIKKLKVTSPDLFPNLDGFSNYVTQGKSKIVAYLLENGGDPNHQGALNGAAQVGSLTMVRQLLEAGADPKLKGNWGAFHTAINKDRWQIAGLLAKNGADLKLSWPHILMETGVMDFGPERVKFLVNHGADPNYVRKSWNSNSGTGSIGIPLHDAVRLKKHDYAKLLLKLGAKVDLARPTDGVRALHLACQKGDEKMIRILIDAGADLEKPTLVRENDSYPRRYVEQGIARGRKPIDTLFVGLAPILIDAGAKLGSMTLHHAVWLGKIEVVDYLISKGADVNQRTSGERAEDQLPLNRAFFEKKDQMVEHLISKGAKLSEVPWDLLTPGYRIKAARGNRYAKLAESGKVHFVFPEAKEVNAATFAVDYDSQIISNLLKLKFPASVSNSNERRVIDYERVTWNLVRAGKVEKIDWDHDEVFQFTAGDVIEVTGFGDFGRNLEFSPFIALERIPGSFSSGVRRLARFPISVTHAGETYEMMMCPDKVTFDARSNELPAGNLGQILDLIFTNSNSDWRHASPVEVHVERPDFPRFTFRSDGEGLNGFELKAGDHISFSGDSNGNLDKAVEALSRWEIYNRRYAVGLRVPGTLGAWQWPLVKNMREKEMESAPTLLAVIADVNAGYEERDESMEKNIFKQLTSKKFKRVFPGLDLSRIVINRLKEGDEEEQIVINLAGEVEKWVSGGKKEAPFDVQLQKGDVVDVFLEEGEWKGFSSVTNQYFEAALNVPLIMSQSGSTDSFALNFKMPVWSDSPWGLVSIAEKNTRSTIHGVGLLTNQIGVQRGGKNYTFPSGWLYWPKAGDVLSVGSNGLPPRPPAPGLPRRRVPSSSSLELKEWPPSYGEKVENEKKSSSKRTRYTPRPKSK